MVFDRWLVEEESKAIGRLTLLVLLSVLSSKKVGQKWSKYLSYFSYNIEPKEVIIWKQRYAPSVEENYH